MRKLLMIAAVLATMVASIPSYAETDYQAQIDKINVVFGFWRTKGLPSNLASWATSRGFSPDMNAAAFLNQMTTLQGDDQIGAAKWVNTAAELALIRLMGCGDDASLQNAANIFNAGPYAIKTGIKVIRVWRPQQVLRNGVEVRCIGDAMLNNGTERPLFYRFTLRHGELFVHAAFDRDAWRAWRQ